MSGRIPSLDGLRAISIALVLLGHAAGTSGSPIPLVFARYAHLGVLIFFVISGYLITNLLIREREKHGGISLKVFYLARTLRIFPLAYLFTFVIGVTSALGWIQLGKWDLLNAATYTANMNYNRSWWIGHLWSLAVEEQFYLLWPFAMAHLLPGRAAIAALIFVVIGPISRLTVYRVLGTDLPIFTSVADSLAMGCLLSLYRNELHSFAWYKRLHTAPLFMTAVLIITALNATASYPRIFWGASLTVMTVLIALCIDRVVSIPDDATGRLLNHPNVAFIGRLSYSLYMWQQLFLARGTVTVWTSWPVNLIAVFVCALASFYLVEEPISRFRARSNRSARRRTMAAAAGGI